MSLVLYLLVILRVWSSILLVFIQQVVSIIRVALFGHLFSKLILYLDCFIVHVHVLLTVSELLISC